MVSATILPAILSAASLYHVDFLKFEIKTSLIRIGNGIELLSYNAKSLEWLQAAKPAQEHITKLCVATPGSWRPHSNQMWRNHWVYRYQMTFCNSRFVSNLYSRCHLLCTRGLEVWNRTNRPDFDAAVSLSCRQTDYLTGCPPCTKSNLTV